MIPLKDIMIMPGQRIDLSETPGESVIEKIRKAYGVIADAVPGIGERLSTGNL